MFFPRVQNLLYLLICLPLLLLSAAPAAADQEQESEFLLSGEVLIHYDVFGVPHITASNDADLLFAQGYVTARDRLWQMEYNRRLVAGRLAEILGESYVEQDYEIRRLGLYRSSVATYETLSDEMKKLSIAFAAGVNHYVNTHQDHLPREFKDLGYVPEPWHPIDSTAIPRMMFWHLSGSLEEELMLAKLVDELGPDKALELVSSRPADPETHIRWRQAAEILPQAFGAHGFPILAALEDFSRGHGAARSIGSNNWVIDGTKSATGAPILANDPHLALLNPPIWHEAHLMGPGINVIGSTFPGVPGIIIGHNEHIAWGVTNVGYDVCDLYIEKRDPENNKNYLYKGESRPFRKVTEKIAYRSGGSMKKVERDILFTLHGPVVAEEENHVVSMRWTGHEPSTEFKYMYLLNRASNVAEFRDALNFYQVGAQNFVYADIDGNIFYQPTGKVPIRNGAPYLPLDGSSGECEWESYIPYDSLPSVLNPEEHFIATANARPVDEAYPFYIGYFFDIGYRVRRIKDLLSAKEKLTFEEVQAIQGDDYVLAAERLKPLLLEAIEAEKKLLPARTLQAAALIEQWDNYSTTDSAACTIFNKWLERIAFNALHDDLTDESFEYWASNPDIIVVLLVRSASPDELKFDWFDNARTERRETKNQIIARSLQEVLDDFSFRYGFQMKDWAWGKTHTTTLTHGMGKINASYNNGPHPRRGCNDTINNAGFPFFNKTFASGSGPSLRMAVELRPGVERAENVIPGGQCANPASPHYQDQLVNLWLRNKAHPMLFSREQLQNNLEGVLKLVPAESEETRSEK
ncbi:MAG: penicillin acylase family protein [Candidatus Abyssobacteria bacterium SURF_5]|uniref:Penicillin acylase family protein n=1 Tax=Abyssobacteria bacterium (strain SURF_5) TaxID=2093360 RepID=A0A3A4NQF2_ABYX5|nr:MAG: penicillin acylase family protein [Candidatus Abyssubacteria bacterium SURF_5]